MATSSAHARRVALVIGNGAYEHATRLQNPTNDATDIAAALKRLDFEVIEGRDVGTDKFDAAVQSFAAKVVGAEIALFYYSGHGLQFDGANYLVPVDARIDSVTALKRRAVIAQDVVDQMERGAKASLVFLDACRNNTLTRELAQSLPDQTRNSTVSRGLARMTANGNSLIAFAAAPNDVAADGTGSRNSPFTAAVLKHIETPNIVVPEMLTEVTADVVRATSSRQKPEVLSRLVTQVRMKVAAAVVVPPPPIVIPTPPFPEMSREREAAVAWDTLKSSCDRGALSLFRGRYGDTFFGDMAKRRDEQIETRAVCAPVGAPLVAPPTAGSKGDSAPVAPQKTTTVAPESKAEPAKPTALRDDLRFVSDLQRELKRVGCFDADIDGKWGVETRTALTKFQRQASLTSTSEPEQSHLEAIRSKSQRVCPLVCPAGEMAIKDRCERDTKSIVESKDQPTRQKRPEQVQTGFSTAGCEKKASSTATCSVSADNCKSSTGTLKDCNAAFRECMQTGQWVYRRPDGKCFHFGTRQKI